ncbi:MAG: hypothetical protein QXF21_05615, partial [Thermoproteota archaeon]
SLMSIIVALSTRAIRINPLEGLIVGVGYALGGFAFDLLSVKLPKVTQRDYLYLLITIISGSAASLPYLLSRIYFLGSKGFLVASPLYLFSTARSVAFSLIGAGLGLQINHRLKRYLKADGSVKLGDV